MTAEDVLSQVRACGWTVVLTEAGPALERATPGVPSLSPKVIEKLKKHRTLVIRHLIYVKLLARACGKQIWGYDSDDGRPHVTYPKKGIPDGWDRMAVEGDETWTPMPKLIVSD